VRILNLRGPDEKFTANYLLIDLLCQHMLLCWKVPIMLKIMPAHFANAYLFQSWYWTPYSNSPWFN